jgi:hypothetical protein
MLHPDFSYLSTPSSCMHACRHAPHVAAQPAFPLLHQRQAPLLPDFHYPLHTLPKCSFDRISSERREHTRTQSVGRDSRISASAPRVPCEPTL